MSTRIRGLGYLLTLAAILVGPWLFGAWEVWWFWPHALVIFLGASALGLWMATRGADADGSEEALGQTPSYPWLLISAAAVLALFLAYLGIRTLQAEVRFGAVRMFLLFLLPALVGLQMVFGARQAQRDRLATRILTVNFLLLGVYGIVNHLITDSKYVLWRGGYEQYMIDHRATGSYFCPNHFAGIMELGVAVGLGLAMARRNTWALRLAGLGLALVGVVSVVMSKSRGGGLALLAMALGAIVVGLYQYSPLKRWALRVSLLAILMMLVAIAYNSRHPYVVRFKTTLGADKKVPTLAELHKRVEPDCRWQMPMAALRMWREHPWFGIGPGMHQELWLHYAATPDGDRARNIWPKYLNNDYHSFEVHSDWIQLLEETGLVGFGTFLTGVVLLVVWFMKRLIEIGRRQRRKSWKRRDRLDPDPYAMPLAALLAIIAMAAHSVVDFNLQMPATGWVLAAVIAMAGACSHVRSGLTETGRGE